MRIHALATLLLILAAPSQPVATAFAADAPVSGDKEFFLARFDHWGHNRKVFEPQKVDCASCHNFTLNPATKELTPARGYQQTVLSRPLMSICHECHKTAEAKHRKAPKACYTCHRSVESLATVAPRNHQNNEWRRSHAINARADGDDCMNCHMQSQCVKCHLQRNDIELVNHTRNFRFTHSVQARLEPHRCDTCHSQNFCVKCHTNSK